MLSPFRIVVAVVALVIIALELCETSEPLAENVMEAAVAASLFLGLSIGAEKLQSRRWLGIPLAYPCALFLGFCIAIAVR